MRITELIDEIIDESTSLKQALSKLKGLTQPQGQRKHDTDIQVSGYVVRSFYRAKWHRNVISNRRFNQLRRQHKGGW
jgi:hypothetical protein